MQSCPFSSAAASSGLKSFKRSDFLNHRIQVFTIKCQDLVKQIIEIGEGLCMIQGSLRDANAESARSRPNL